MKNISTLVFATNSNMNVSEQIDEVALEGIHSVVEGVAGITGNVSMFFSSTMTKGMANFSLISEKIGSIMPEDNPRDKGIETAKKDISKVLIAKKFTDVEHIEVPVTVGLDGKLLDIVTILDETFDGLDEKVFKAIQSLDKTLADIANDKEYRHSFRPSKKEFKEVNKLNSELEDVLFKIIDKDSEFDRQRLSRLLGNLQEMPIILSKVSKLESEVNSLAILRDLETKTQRLSEKVGIVYEIATEDTSSKFQISKQALSELSNGLESVAKLVSTYSGLLAIKGQVADTSVQIVTILNEG